MQRKILGDREVENEPTRLPVLGGVHESGMKHCERAVVGEVFPLDAHAARFEFLRPESASTSSLWPLPATPATPTISPARTSNETPRTASSLRSSMTWGSSTSKEWLARGGRLLVDPKHDVAANHHPGEALLGCALA